MKRIVESYFTEMLTSMKQYQRKYKWLVAIFCIIIITSNFPLAAYAQQFENVNCPLQKIIDGDKKLNFETNGKMYDNDTVLLAQSDAGRNRRRT